MRTPLCVVMLTAGLVLSFSINLHAADPNDWTTSGNSGTTPGSDFVGTTDAQGLVFKVNNAEAMRLTSSGALAVGTNQVSAGFAVHIVGKVLADGVLEVSDQRQKTDVEPLEGALDKITQLQGVSYVRKGRAESTDGKELGLIAQDVKKVLPEVVAEGEDGLQTLSYTRLVPLLIEAVKEQQVLIEKQQAQIDALTKASKAPTQSP